MEDLTRRERLQRVLARLNRMHEPQSTASDNAYGNRTPSPNQQNLYDWAPAPEEGNEDNELENILGELRRQQPETPSEILRLLSRNQMGERRDSPARAASYMRVNGNETYAQVTERRQRERQQNLRNRAALQSARQGSSPSATERMLRYVMERERSGLSEEEERARGAGWFRPTPRAEPEHEDFVGSSSWSIPPRADDTRERDRQERVEAFRRGYLAEHAQARLPGISAMSTNSSLFLENALKYLDDLRECSSYEDALATAIDNNLATKEFFADKHDDFIMDLSDLGKPAPSSWVQPGAVFEGHQHASTASMNITHNRPAQQGAHIEQINPNYRPSENTHPAYYMHYYDPSRPTAYPTPIPLNLRATTPKASDSANDHWPVRVKIHDIDWDKMTIQGTMEAYDVPQHPASTVNIVHPGEAPDNRPKAGKKSAPITTYLEGHILDHHAHSFLTPQSPNPKRRGSSASTLGDTISFPSATPHLDAQNWLALPPFNSLCQGSGRYPTPGEDPRTASPAAADAFARLILSTTQLRQLSGEYIFMRWKERCFVHSRHDDCCTSSSSDRLGDQDRGHGLTISGFYYVSLRRSDGEVEGLYFDPSSTPYQLLRLKGRTAGWGSFELR